MAAAANIAGDGGGRVAAAAVACCDWREMAREMGPRVTDLADSGEEEEEGSEGEEGGDCGPGDGGQAHGQATDEGGLPEA